MKEPCLPLVCCPCFMSHTQQKFFKKLLYSGLPHIQGPRPLPPVLVGAQGPHLLPPVLLGPSPVGPSPPPSAACSLRVIVVSERRLRRIFRDPSPSSCPRGALSRRALASTLRCVFRGRRGLGAPPPLSVLSLPVLSWRQRLMRPFTFPSVIPLLYLAQ